MFDLVFKVVSHYHAAYNWALIAKHVQDSHSSGGLFSSQTTNSVIDTNSSSEEFKMEMESNQASYEFENTLRAEVKTELINRVLTELALVNGQAVQLPTRSLYQVHTVLRWRVMSWRRFQIFMRK